MPSSLKNYLVNIVNLIGNVLKAIHETIMPFLLYSFKILLSFAGMTTRSFKFLIGFLKFLPGHIQFLHRL